MSRTSSALVTGTRRGLGKALSEKLKADGWEVRTLDRSSIDLSHHDAIPGAVAAAINGLENLDLVLLNAGVLGGVGDLKDRTVEEFRGVMDVNVWANKIIIDSVLRLPVKHIVALSSGASHHGAGGLGPYSISKAALNVLLRVYASEQPETHFTAVVPGHVATDLMNRIQQAPEDPRYTTIDRLKKAAGTSLMQSPEQAAAKLINCLPQMRAIESGAYVDVRKFA